MACAGYFPPAPPSAALCIAKQNSRPPPSSAALRPLSLRSAVQVRSARRLVIATKAAMGAADPTKGHHHDDRPRRHRLRAAARLIPDRPRPHRTPALRLPPLPGRARPETAARSRRIVAGAVADIFDALVATLERHPPRTRPRGPALVDRQSLPPRHRPDRARTRRQRAGAAAQPDASRMARKSARSNSSASPPRA